MEIKKKFVGYFPRDKYSLSVQKMDFKGTDLQRMGDLISCPMCPSLHRRGFIVRHILLKHNIPKSKVSSYLPGDYDVKKHTYETPIVDWFRVEIITSCRNDARRFAFFCHSKALLDAVVACDNITDLYALIKSDVYSLPSAKEFFEELIAYKFKRHIGTKEDNDYSLKYPILPEQCVSNTLKNKMEELELPRGYGSSYYFLELDRQIDLLELGEHRDKLHSLMTRCFNNRCCSPGVVVMASALIYYYLRSINNPITWDEFTVRVGKGYHFTKFSPPMRRISKCLGKKSFNLLDLISIFVSEMGISPETEIEMRSLIEPLYIKGVFSGKKPLGILVGAWFYVEKRPAQGVTYQDKHFSPYKVTKLVIAFSEYVYEAWPERKKADKELLTKK